MRIWQLTLVIALLSSLISVSCGETGDPLSPPGTQPVYFLAGSPYEMGYQYGVQAAEPIRITRDATKAQVLRRYSPEELDLLLDAYDAAIRRDVPDFDSAAFMQGIVDGTNQSGASISYRDVVMLHNQIALLYYQNITDNGMCTIFSTTGNKTPPIAGANYDMQNGLVAAYFGTIVAYPTGGIPFIATANAGKLTNSLVMNEKGVLLAVAKSMQVTKENKTILSVNTAISGPVILMHAASAQEASTRMQSTPVPFGLNHLIVDSGGDGYVVERFANLTGVRVAGDNGEDGYLIATNHFLTPVMKEVQKPWDPKVGYPSSYYRYVTAEQMVLGTGKKPDIPASMKILSNTSYYDGVKWIPQAAYTGNTINRFDSFGGTLQSEVMDLKNRTLYVCSGNPLAPEWNRFAPDQTGEYVKISLKSSPEATVRDVRASALDQMQKTAMLIGTITAENPYSGYLMNVRFDEVKSTFWAAEYDLVNASTEPEKSLQLKKLSDAASGYAKVQAEAQYIRRSSAGMPGTGLTESPSSLPEGERSSVPVSTGTGNRIPIGRSGIIVPSGVVA